jgi:hypothetical protein
MKMRVTAVSFLGNRSVPTRETNSATAHVAATNFQLAAIWATGCTNCSRFGDIAPHQLHLTME